MKIDVLGCGSAFSLQHNTSAICVTDNHQQRWLIDCGPTIPRTLWQRRGDVNDIDAIYFTHVHPDHCTGLTALLNHWKSFGRRKPLIIWSQREQRAVLMQLARLANWPNSDLCFGIEWRDSEPDFHWQGWRIRTAFTHHEIPNLALRIDADERTLFYSGDGRPTPESIALMHRADVAFQECTSLTALPADASHGDLPGCLALRDQLHLPRLGLYHCNDAAREALAQACAVYPGLFLCQDGMVIDLSHCTEEHA
ncbi:ribonuclease Z [Kosakonia sp.]|uniref:MBL fold metallo-hydrolase n=1 Tax=Kosakonia sp. TaxID=1916651 RepID=UPI00289FCE59|nr:ribonuclease Z [Kosakonia sp.]